MTMDFFFRTSSILNSLVHVHTSILWWYRTFARGWLWFHLYYLYRASLSEIHYSKILNHLYQLRILSVPMSWFRDKSEVRRHTSYWKTKYDCWYNDGQQYLRGYRCAYLRVQDSRVRSNCWLVFVVNQTGVNNYYHLATHFPFQTTVIRWDTHWVYGKSESEYGHLHVTIDQVLPHHDETLSSHMVR